jgi:hypothetical protein
LLVATVLLGLATRRFPAAFPGVIARFGGDALWAVMVLWIAALVWRGASTQRLALSALAIAYAVEISQLYRAPWIEAVRATRGGALMLGQGFLWSDLVSYVVGVALAAGLDVRIVRSQWSRTEPGR